MKKRFVRWMILLLILALCLSVLAACETGGEDDPDDPDDPVNPDNPVNPDDPPEHEHSYGAWKVVQEPTCLEEGTEKRTCECGDSQTRSIEPLGHDPVTPPSVAPGCETTGLKGGEVCARCGAEVKKQEVVPSLGGHVYNGTNTCTRCHAVEPVPDGVSFTKRSDGTYELTAYTGSATSLTLNRVYKGIPVTSIRDRVFYGKTALSSVILPSTLRRLGSSVFEGCTSLGNVTLPDGLTEMGTGTFRNCTSMTACVIPASLSVIGDYAYAGCTSITSVTVRNGVTTVGTGAFMGTSVSQVSLPASVLTVNNYAYKDCVRLGNVTVPATVTTVGDMAFDGCVITRASVPAGACSAVANEALTNVEVTGTGSIPYGAFRNSPNLTNVTVARTITGIACGAFEGCGKIALMSIPFVGDRAKTETDTWQYPFGYIFGTRPFDGAVATTQEFYGDALTDVTSETYYVPTSLTTVTLLGGEVTRGAFYNCRGLLNVTVPNVTTKFGDYAFYRCEKLNNINFPQVLTNIGAETFCGCNLQTVSLSAKLTSIGDGAFRDCPITSATAPAGFLDFLPKARLVSVSVNGGSEIMANAFNGCAYLQNVSFAASVNKIGVNAFKDCAALRTVAVSNLSNWYATVFDNDAANPMMYATVLTVGGNPVTDYAVPEGTVSLKHHAFYNVTTLQSVTLPSSLTTIGAYAFYNCQALSSINIADSRVSYVGAYAFAQCYGLRSLTLPSTLRTIGSCAFAQCYGLLEATIPAGAGPEVTTQDGVTRTAERIFDECYKLVHLANGSAERDDGTGLRITSSPAVAGGEVVKSTDAAFRYELARDASGVVTYRVGAESDKKVYFVGYEGTEATVDLSGTDVTDVYAFALYGNEFVKTVVLHNRIGSIGEKAFFGCSSLKEVKVVEKDASVTDSNITVGFGAFDETAITDASLPVSALDYLDVSKLENLTIVSGRVEAAMELDLGGVKHLTIGEDVSVVYEGAIVSAPNLETITVAEKNRNYVGIGDCLIGSTNKTLILGSQNSVIPEDGTVTRIGNYAFSETKIASVVIPDRVGSIGNYAFRNCAALTSVSFGNRLSTIGMGAFYGCTALTEANVPASVSSLGENAFGGCSALTYVSIGRGVTTIYEGTFFGCSALTEMYLPFVGETGGSSSSAYRFPFGIIFGRTAYYGTFEGAQIITQTLYEYGTDYHEELTVNVPASLRKLTIAGGRIEKGAFEGCSNLTAVVIGDVDGIGEYAFYGCAELTEVTVLTGLTSIGTNAFASLPKLKTVILPESVTAIEYGAFSDCVRLEQINFPVALRTIGERAFYGCSSLRRLKFFAVSGDGKPALESIGSYAFGASGLNYIVYEGTKAQWNALEKVVHWAGDSPSYTVNCLDGNTMQ